MLLKGKGSKKNSHILTERRGKNYWVCTSYENLASGEKDKCYPSFWISSSEPSSESDWIENFQAPIQSSNFRIFLLILFDPKVSILFLLRICEKGEEIWTQCLWLIMVTIEVKMLGHTSCSLLCENITNSLHTSDNNYFNSFTYLFDLIACL